jgi:uncharacterized coiled-coil DUF342 family protein
MARNMTLRLSGSGRSEKKLMKFMTWFSVYGLVKQAIQDVIAPEIQALRGDIRAIDTRIDGLKKRFDQRFDGIDKRFGQVDKRFDQMDVRFDLMDRRQDQFDRRMEQMETLFRTTDQRWHVAIDIHERLATVEAKLERLQSS